MRLLSGRVEAARMLAPLDGVVISGDWHQRLGAPVRLGDILFEVSPLDSLEAELRIPAEDIGGLEAGAVGELAVAGAPDRKIAFIITRVAPMAEVIGQRNVFRARARLEQVPDWLRPGMEGLAKVDRGRRSYAWLWTRRAVNWLRMQLWM